MGVETVLSSLGIDYQVRGDEAVARCPAHDDTHPSWSFNLRNCCHHCFSCGFSGNLAHLVAYIRGVPYAEAVIWANSKVGWSKAHMWREDYRSKHLSPPVMKVSEADLALFTSPPVERLEERHISVDAAALFGVLWNDRRQEWVFPIRDPYTSELWGFQAKSGKHYRAYPAHIPRSKALFGLGAAAHGGTIVLVESPIDCARLYSAGISGGCSGYGVSVSSSQFSLVLERTEHVVLAFDNDLPGIQGTARAASELRGIRVSVWDYKGSTAKDPGEQSDEEIADSFSSAVPVLKWLREHKPEKCSQVS